MDREAIIAALRKDPSGRLLLDMAQGLAAGGETLATMGSGMAGQIAGGWRGLTDLMAGKSLEEAARSVDEPQRELTYRPRTEGGADVQQRLGQAMEPLQKATHWAGENTADLLGSPLAGALVASTLEAGQQFLPGMEGEGAVAKAAALRRVGPRWYSAVEEALTRPGARKAAAPAETWRNWLLKQKDVRPEELRFRGLDELFQGSAEGKEAALAQINAELQQAAAEHQKLFARARYMENRGASPLSAKTVAANSPEQARISALRGEERKARNAGLVTRDEILQRLSERPAGIEEKTLFDTGSEAAESRGYLAKAIKDEPTPKVKPDEPHPLNLPEHQQAAILADRLEVETLADNHVRVTDPVTGFRRDFVGNEVNLPEAEMRRTTVQDIFGSEAGDAGVGGRRFSDEDIFPMTSDDLVGTQPQRLPESHYESEGYRSKGTREPGSYQEILFSHPEADFPQKHYGRDSTGLIGAMRTTERKVPKGKRGSEPSYHVEEYQSDLHQAGQEKGYTGMQTPAEVARYKLEADATKSTWEKTRDAYRAADKAADDLYYKLENQGLSYTEITRHPEMKAAEQAKEQAQQVFHRAEQAHNEAVRKMQGGEVPPAPWMGDRWMKQMVRRALRGAAEMDLPVLSWTDSETQVKRWSDKYRKAYQNVYDNKAKAYTQGEVRRIAQELGLDPTEINVEHTALSNKGTKASPSSISVWSDTENGVQGWRVNTPDGDSFFYPRGPGRTRETARAAGVKAAAKSPGSSSWALRLPPEVRAAILKKGFPIFGVSAALSLPDGKEQ